MIIILININTNQYQYQYQYGDQPMDLQSFINAMDAGEHITIDGSLYQGGGQMIRSSLALSIILGKEFTIHSIRKNRPNPGINNQLRNIFSAFLEKVPKVGDTQLYFYPHFLKPTEIKANTAASCTLMMQCLVPICVGLQFQSEIVINGGTDVNRSPPLESVRLGLMPLLSAMNIRLNIIDVKPGYFPTGRGHVTIKVDPIIDNTIKPIVRKVISAPSKVVVTYYIKDKNPPNSSKQFRKEIKRIITNHFGEDIKLDIEVKAQKVFNTKDEYGIGCLVLGESLVWDVGTVGEKIEQAKILERLEHYCQRKPCLDEHHQDQLLLYCALAAGKSELLVGEELSLHTQSLIYIINSFLPQCKIEHHEGILSIEGISYKCQPQ